MKKNIIIIILLLCLIGTSGYIVYDNYLYADKKEDNEKNIDNNNQKDTKKNLNVNSIYIKELIDRYNYYFINDFDLEKTLYGKTNTTPDNFQEDFIKQTAVYASNEKYGYTTEQLHEQIRKLYGPNITIKDSSFVMNCGTYEYDGINNMYTRKESEGCGGSSMSYLNRKIVEARKEDSKLLIDVAVARVDNENNVVLNTTGEAIDGITAETFNIDKDYDKINRYRYTFTYDEENYNYYLESITKI